MAKLPAVGISDIAIYLPRLKIELETIIAKRAKEIGGPRLEKVLRRTLKCTGLLTMHFPEVWEDSVTMAAQAAHKLIRRQKISLQALRYLATGTETTVDHSKPIAAYVSGILKKAGLKIPQTLSTFQTQHACAGGTLALLGISALLAVTGPSEESGIVICSDVARYERATSAEMTQGAGAVALLAETNPKLIELDLSSVGYSSKDVDDFFRPLGSDIAKVRGTFSIRCYMEAMESALLNHAQRSNMSPQEVFESADMLAFHVPYPKLPVETMEHLLHKYLKLSKDQAKAYLEERGFGAMTYPAALSGNIYSGSMYMSLAFLLKDRFEKYGDQIIGKKILMGSYGSGNTLAFISGRIAEGAAEVIGNWNLESLWQEDPTNINEYERWATSNGTTPAAYSKNLEDRYSRIRGDSFYLGRIREDGYREYLYRE